MRTAIVLSVPKCGTHLLLRTIHILGYRREKLFKSWHTRYREDTIKMFDEKVAQGVKGVLIIRDLRDAAASHVHWVAQTDHHTCRPWLERMDIETRLLYSIIGIRKSYVPEGMIRNIIPDFLHFYREMCKWRERPEIYTVKFEDLVGGLGGGSDEVQMRVIKDICRHLGRSDELEENEVIRIRNNLWMPFTDKIRRKGVIGDWKNHFKPWHKEIAKRLWGQVLIDEGYEKDLNW